MERRLPVGLAFRSLTMIAAAVLCLPLLAASTVPGVAPADPVSSLERSSTDIASREGEAKELQRVHVPGFRFDPLVEGEPSLAPEARADGAGHGLRLVQFRNPLQQGNIDSLKTAGATPLQYYPHDTYLIWGSEAAAGAVAELDSVRWQGLFHPAYKVRGALGAAHQQDATAEELFYIVFFDDGDRRATLDALVASGAKVQGAFPAQPDRALWAVEARLPWQGLAAVAQIPTVLWVGERGPGPQLAEEMSSQIVAGNHPGGVPVTGYLSHLSTLGVDGSDVVWAVNDTGMDYEHPDVGSRIVGGFSGGTCDPAGQPGSDCSGTRGHGTHVAGIMGGNAAGAFSDSDGFLYGLGVAPEVDFVAVDIFSSNDPFQDYTRVAVLAGASGSNNSWSSGMANGYFFVERIFDFIVRDGNFDSTEVAEPHTAVFAAGNAGPLPSSLSAPNEAKNTIVVAGTQNYRSSMNIEEMYSFSGRGPTTDGRFGLTVAAPGQTVISARNDLGGQCTSSVVADSDSLYSFCSGTSMASPHVAGAAVLFTEWWRHYQGGTDPSPALTKAVLVNSAVPVTTTPDIPNFDVGWGRIDLTKALQPESARIFEDQGVVFEGAGEEWTLEVRVAEPALPLKISLAWSDAPGALGANPALVNDLDLTVEVGGVTYLGNEFAGGWSQAGGLADVLNNEENVFVQNPGPGTATITVAATAINGDGIPLFGDETDQDFALVCTNCLPGAGLIFADGFESGDTSLWSLTFP